MKKFFIFIFLTVALMIWFEDWTSSGRMDAFIQEHSTPSVTPNLLFVLGEGFFSLRETKGAAHYYRWLLDEYPGYAYAPRARFHLAESYEENGDRARAMEQYVVLKDSFTNTSYGLMSKRKWEMSRF